MTKSSRSTAPPTASSSPPLLLCLLAVSAAAIATTGGGGRFGVASAFLPPTPLSSSGAAPAPAPAVAGARYAPPLSSSSLLFSPTIAPRRRRGVIIRQRRQPSPSPQGATALRSFFGLGPAELAIIAVAGLVLVGPAKLMDFSREAGSVAGKTASGMGNEWSEELKAIPEEFRKGVEEGEIEARSRKAKTMDGVGGEDDEKGEP